jgi:chorismate mutase
MEIAREIGVLKRENGMMVFQPLRYNEIMERYVKFCADGKIEVDAVREIFEIIHSESIRQQLTVMNGNEA